MLYRVGDVRRVICEAVADERLMSQLHYFAKHEQFGWGVWRQIVQMTFQELRHTDGNTTQSVLTDDSSFGYYSDRASERYYCKPSVTGEIVISEQWPGPYDLWLVIEVTHFNDLYAHNLRTGEEKVLTSWYVIPATDVLHRTIEQFSNGAIDWRPGETLPEDFYAL